MNCSSDCISFFPTYIFEFILICIYLVADLFTIILFFKIIDNEGGRGVPITFKHKYGTPKNIITTRLSTLFVLLLVVHIFFYLFRLCSPHFSFHIIA